VSSMQVAARKALADAFVTLPIFVVKALPAKFEHGVRVAGNWTSYTGENMSLSSSYVYYPLVMDNAQRALIYDTTQAWSRPSYPPLNSQEIERFKVLMRAIGKGIGRIAAHEIGHQLSLLSMDCGHDLTRPGGPLPCDGPNNFVYNFFSGTGMPQDPSDPDSTGGQFFYIDIPNYPLHWSPKAYCGILNYAYSEDADCTR
jgi:hypothetical protein